MDTVVTSVLSNVQRLKVAVFYKTSLCRQIIVWLSLHLSPDVNG